MVSARRAKYLLSGLLTCGVCGGGMSVISQTHVGCSAARNKGICNNRKSIARKELENRVLTALSSQLMDPKLFEVFCEEFVAETNRLRSAAAASWTAREAELSQTNRALDRLVQALIDGAPASSVKAKMKSLECKRAQLEAELANSSAPPPALHPNLAKLYREKVSSLATALNTPEAQADAALSLRRDRPMKVLWRAAVRPGYAAEAA